MTAIELEINWRIRDDRYRHNAKRGEYLTSESGAGKWNEGPTGSGPCWIGSDGWLTTGHGC